MTKDYELFVETDEGIQRLTEPPKTPPRRAVGPRSPAPPKQVAKQEKKKELTNGDTDQA